jgi:DnaK suppressor protein
MDPEHARELLARERARIERALGDATQRGGEGKADAFEARQAGEDLFTEELEEAQAERLRQELQAIERAERRLAEGTYGISVDSGQPIPDGRLEAIPWAERTAEEQARYAS